MSDLDDIVHCPLDLPDDSYLFQHMVGEIQQIPQSFWFWDEYRTTNCLPLFTNEGEIHKEQNIDIKRPLDWTETAKYCPTILQYCNDYIFSWMEPHGRVMILKTPAGKKNALHIDCTKRQAVAWQPKFRIVLQGPVTSLWFLDKNLKPVFIRGDNRVYIIDGRHPHGMWNIASQDKYTLVVGYPWTGKKTTAFQELMNRSIIKYNDLILRRSKIGIFVKDEWYKNYGT